MKLAPLIFVAAAVALLVMSKGIFGRTAANIPASFREADADGSGSVDFDEFWSHFYQHERRELRLIMTPTAAVSDPIPTSTPSPPPLVDPDLMLQQPAGDFDNSFMRLSKSAASPPSPPPPPPPLREMPPPPPLPLLAEKFDNSFMRLGQAERPLLRAGQAPAAAAVGADSAVTAAVAPAAAADPDARHLAGVDPVCNPTLHAGYAGGSLGWGMTFKVATAKECCEACQAHARVCASGKESHGKAYYQRSWEGKVTEEKCAATMSSNEDGTHAAQGCNGARPAGDRARIA